MTAETTRRRWPSPSPSLLLVVPILALLLAPASLLVGCGGGGGGGGGGGSAPPPAGDSAPPQITSTNPVANATSVPIDVVVSATFNEALNSGTVGLATVQLRDSVGNLVPRTVSLVGTTVLMDPVDNLAYGAVYTATLTTGITDLAGNRLAVSYSWSFTTATGGGGPPPNVVAVTPVDNATDVPVNTVVTVVFDRALATVTLSLKPSGGSPVAVSTTIDGASALFVPAAELAPNTLYIATIDGTSKGPVIPGAPFPVPYTWTFTTGATSALQGTLVADNSLAGYPLSGLTVGAYRLSDNLIEILSWDNAVSMEGGRYAFPTLSGGAGYYYLIVDARFPTGSVRRLIAAGYGWFNGTSATINSRAFDATPQPGYSAAINACGWCHGRWLRKNPPIDNSLVLWGGYFSGAKKPCASSDDRMCGVVIPDNDAKPPAGLLDEYRRTTCESCHGYHLPTGFAKFLNWDTSTPLFCLICH